MQYKQKVDVVSENVVVTKAVQRAAGALGLNQRELGQVLGVSEAKVSRLGRETQLDEQKKEFELAVLLLRLYRSLDALVGGDEAKVSAWIHAHNHYFNDTPANLIKKI